MITIKFRGKTISGKWVYGNLSILNKNFSGVDAGYYISNTAGAPFAYQVIPEKVIKVEPLLIREGSNKILSNKHLIETQGIITKIIQRAKSLLK